MMRVILNQQLVAFFMNWNSIHVFPFVSYIFFSKLCLQTRDKGFHNEEAHNFNMQNGDSITSMSLRPNNPGDLIIAKIRRRNSSCSFEIYRKNHYQ